MTLTLLNKSIKFDACLLKFFASKFLNVICKLHVSFFVSAFLSKVCDVGDLPVKVLSFGFGN